MIDTQCSEFYFTHINGTTTRHWLHNHLHLNKPPLHFCVQAWPTWRNITITAKIINLCCHYQFTRLLLFNSFYVTTVYASALLQLCFNLTEHCLPVNHPLCNLGMTATIRIVQLQNSNTIMFSSTQLNATQLVSTHSVKLESTPGYYTFTISTFICLILLLLLL